MSPAHKQTHMHVYTHYVHVGMYHHMHVYMHVMTVALFMMYVVVLLLSDLGKIYDEMYASFDQVMPIEKLKPTQIPNEVFYVATPLNF